MIGSVVLLGLLSALLLPGTAPDANMRIHGDNAAAWEAPAGHQGSSDHTGYVAPVGDWQIAARFDPQIDIARNFDAAGHDLDLQRGPRDFYFDAVLVQGTEGLTSGVSCEDATALRLVVIAETEEGLIELDTKLLPGAPGAWAVGPGALRVTDRHVPDFETYAGTPADLIQEIALTCLSTDMAAVTVRLDGTLIATTAGDTRPALSMTMNSTAEAPLIDAKSYRP